MNPLFAFLSQLIFLSIRCFLHSPNALHNTNLCLVEAFQGVLFIKNFYRLLMLQQGLSLGPYFFKTSFREDGRRTFVANEMG